jgi:hypothetical protein
MNRPRLTQHYAPMLDAHVRESSQNRQIAFEQLFPARLYRNEDLVCELSALDSLHIYQISQKFGFSIDLLLSPLTTIGQLRRIVENGNYGDETHQVERNLAMLEAEQISKDMKLIDGWERDMADEFGVDNSAGDEKNKQEDKGNGKTILLTGASGFVGSEILMGKICFIGIVCLVV